MIERNGWRRCALCTAASAVLVLGMSGSAHAAPRTVTTKKLGAGSTAITPCGLVSAITVSYAVKAAKIVGVTLSNIPSGCFTGLLSVTLTQGTVDVGHAGPTAIVTGTLALVPHLLTTNATAPTFARISIVGP
jgi:hypothetical protein